MRTAGPGLRSVFCPPNSGTWYCGPPAQTAHPRPDTDTEARAAGALTPRLWARDRRAYPRARPV